MRKLILLLFLVSFFSADAQLVFTNISGGYTGYGGDLSDKNVSTKFLLPAFGLGLSVEAGQRFSFNAHWMHGKIKGDDKYSTERAFRNLKFDSDINEVAFTLQYNFLKRENYLFSPYIAGGIAFFHFNPYIVSGLEKVFLHDYHTEGQGVYNGVQPYSLNQISIPWGGGLEWIPDEDVRVGVSAMFRKTFTDYLDDVSGKYAPKELLMEKFGPKSVGLAYRGNLVPGGNAEYPIEGTPRGNAANKDVYYFFGAYLKLRFNLIIGAIDDRKTDHESIIYDCPKW